MANFGVHLVTGPVRPAVGLLRLGVLRLVLFVAFFSALVVLVSFVAG